MTRKPTPAAKTVKKPSGDLSFTNCNFTGQEATNEHTRASVVALAQAIQENARALIATAEALKGPTNYSTGVYITNKDES